MARLWLYANMTTQHSSRARWIAEEVALWLMCSLLVFAFCRAGWAKFDPQSGWSRAFAHWGYPVWFRVGIGVAELAGALLLLWPRTAAYGALLIAVVMLGGMGTHIVLDRRPSLVTNELAPLIFSTLIVIGRGKYWSRSRLVRSG